MEVLCRLVLAKTDKILNNAACLAKTIRKLLAENEKIA